MKGYWKLEKPSPFATSIVILSLNLILILFSSTAFAQYFTIHKFHSDIMINED